MKIGIPNKAFSSNAYLVEKLKKYPFEVILNNTNRRLKGEELILFLMDCDYAIIGLEEINAPILKQLPKLKFISKFGVGMNNINLEDLKKFDVGIKMTHGVNKRAVSELTMSFILSLIRNTHKTSLELKSGLWNKNGGYGLSSMTVGIIGCGMIGQDLLELLAPFNPKILINDIKKIDLPIKFKKYQFVEKDELFAHSDIISIHTPLTSQTNNLINNQVFSKIKKGSFIINTARGGIVNEKDLHSALNDKTIAGAALDVYENEPPKNFELLNDNRVICTPHIAGNSEEAVLKMGNAAIDNLIEYINKNEI